MSDRQPYVGEGGDGARRSAQIDREEADGLPTGPHQDGVEPRRRVPTRRAPRFRSRVGTAGCAVTDFATNVGNRTLAEDNEIIRCVVGSTVHGLGVNDQDDRDLMGVCVEPATYVCGLQQFESYVGRTQPQGARSGPGDVDLTIYSLRKYLRLAVAGNPSILTLFYVPDQHVVSSTQLGTELQVLHSLVVSRRAGPRYLGYLMSQRERLTGGGKRNRVPNRPELISRYGWDTKYAGHALRLGLQGIELLTTGCLHLPMQQADRDSVLAVRRGEVTYDEAVQQITEVEGRLRALVDGRGPSPLRETPNYVALNRWMVYAHQQHWNRWRT